MVKKQKSSLLNRGVKWDVVVKNRSLNDYIPEEKEEEEKEDD